MKLDFLAKIPVFLKNFPVLREILGFFDYWRAYVFSNDFGLPLVPKSRFSYFLDWLFYDVIVNGLPLFLIAVIVFNWPFNLWLILGFGLLRFMFLDLFRDTVLKVARELGKR